MRQIVILLILSILLSATAFGKLLKIEKKKYQAQGVAVVIIDHKSKSSFITREESSEKSPEKLTEDYLFEPGNAMIPISFALLLDKNSNMATAKISDCRNVDMTKIDCKEYNAKDAIVHSSSKIMDIVSVSLKAKDLHNGLKKFGFTHVPSLKKLQQNRYKQICSRGYGIRTNLLELTQAYAIFSYPNNIITEKTAKQMQKLLVEVVKKGTGKNAQLKGMIIGGKTGTALTASKKTKRYSNHYNATFIGFANGKGHRYTIGVLVINPKKGKLAFKTAVNVFRDVVESLLNDPFEVGKREYEKGNIKKAIKLINKACDNGDSFACYNLALLYESGQDVKQDFTKVKKYYKKSCENGFELACSIYKGVYK